jgi:hypothetical protein
LDANGKLELTPVLLRDSQSHRGLLAREVAHAHGGDAEGGHFLGMCA